MTPVTAQNASVLLSFPKIPSTMEDSRYSLLLCKDSFDTFLIQRLAKNPRQRNPGEDNTLSEHICLRLSLPLEAVVH